MTRVERDWFVQMAIVGPRVCTVTVRVDSTRGRGMAAREIIRLVRAWLLEDDTSGHVCLEHRAIRESLLMAGQHQGHQGHKGGVADLES